jgi:F0F1-type ATP synthase membrane subunit b/b'
VAAFAAEGGAGGSAWSGLIFYVVNFLLFVGIVKYFSGALISGFFRERAQTIRRTISGAENALRQAEALSQKAAALIANLGNEKATLARELADETAYLVKQIEEQARDTVERIRRDTTASVTGLREAGQRHLRETLALSASRLAADIARNEFQPADQARLLDDFVGRLGEEARL